ncbi:MAG: class I SAM-dependent methyltransferase [Theionarchaea archaeon]|nr:class I SAM-dependent methyltransferase [Theionarchaea archaeon]
MNSRDITHEVARREELLRLSELTHVPVAVDVGTGDGFSALALSSVSDQVIAVDKDWNHLTKYACNRVSKSILLVQADFLYLPLRSVDLYCSFASWQHALMHQTSTEKLEKAIEEAFKSLNPDGILLVVERLAFFDDWQPQNPFQKNQRVYYTVIENLFHPPIFKEALLSENEFLCMVEKHFQVLTAELVYDRDILCDAFLIL